MGLHYTEDGLTVKGDSGSGRERPGILRGKGISGKVLDAGGQGDEIYCSPIEAVVRKKGRRRRIDLVAKQDALQTRLSIPGATAVQAGLLHFVVLFIDRLGADRFVEMNLNRGRKEKAGRHTGRPLL